MEMRKIIKSFDSKFWFIIYYYINFKFPCQSLFSDLENFQGQKKRKKGGEKEKKSY